MLNKVWLKALRSLDINGRHIGEGERFAAPAPIAGALQLNGDAVPSPASADTMDVPRTESVRPEPQPKRRRGRPRKDDVTAPSYQRRDLRAEE